MSLMKFPSLNMDMISSLSPEAALLLDVARKVASNGGAVMMSKNETNINWQKAKDALFYHRLTPFVYPYVGNRLNIFSDQTVSTLRSSYYYFLKRVFNYECEFLRLNREFEKMTVQFIPIKRIALIEDLYSDCPVRVSSDIDVLVRKEDLEEAGRILQESGYEKDLEGLKESYWKNRQYHLVFIKRSGSLGSITVELHWDIDYPRKDARPWKVFDRLRDASMYGKKVKLLSPEDSLLVIALHLRRFGEVLSLKDVCDAALLLKKYSAVFDWDYILNEVRERKLNSTVFFLFCQINVLLGADIPVFKWKGLEVSAWKRHFIRMFILKNTFLAGQSNCADLYLILHFMLYDNIVEPVSYILNIPQEQFARFFRLKPYAGKTRFLYHFRLFYMAFMGIYKFVYKQILFKIKNAIIIMKIGHM